MVLLLVLKMDLSSHCGAVVGVVVGESLMLLLFMLLVCVRCTGLCGFYCLVTITILSWSMPPHHVKMNPLGEALFTVTKAKANVFVR
jgi:hypothetical protein